MTFRAVDAKEEKLHLNSSGLNSNDPRWDIILLHMFTLQYTKKQLT